MRRGYGIDAGGGWLQRYDIWTRYGGDPREFVVILTTELQRVHEMAYWAISQNVQPPTMAPLPKPGLYLPWRARLLLLGAVLFWVGLAVAVTRC